MSVLFLYALSKFFSASFSFLTKEKDEEEKERLL